MECRGRGTRFLERLKAMTQQPGTSEKTSVSCEPQKSVISNAIMLPSSTTLFEYSVAFSQELQSENQATFLRRHFTAIRKQFIYYNCFVYTPCELEGSDLERSLTNRSSQRVITMRLTLKQKRALESVPKLFDELIKGLDDLNLDIVCEQPTHQIVQSYVHTTRQEPAGRLLFIDCRYYLVENRNVADVVTEFKNLYAERYRAALEILIRQCPIYNGLNRKIYKVQDVIWASCLLKLQNDDELIDVPFELCHMSEAHHIRHESGADLMSNIQGSLCDWSKAWHLHLGPFIRAKARVLPPQTITFGDGVTCTPKNGSWQAQMFENEVVSAIELWCWVILHLPKDEGLARQLGHKIVQLQADTGLSIGKPLYFPIQSDSKRGYMDALSAIVDKNIQLVVVLRPQSPNKPDTLIRHICFVQRPVPCQIIPAAHVAQPRKLHETLLTINAVLGGTSWTVSLPSKNRMICGIGIHSPFEGRRPPVGSFVASFSDDATQWYSRAAFLEKDFRFHLEEWLLDALKKYRSTNGAFPTDLIIYHNCTEDTKTQILEEYRSFRMDGCGDIKLCVVLVQKDTSACYYKDLASGYKNVPTGTVVDNTITHSGAEDFFLVSCQAASHEVARPTYYNVVWNSCGLTPDAIQILTYKLCHLYYKQAWVAEMPAPCKYAEQLGTLIAETTRHIPSPVLDEYLYYL